ncbi:MAG TPA: fumarylacetoacetate hydrolase family protein [Terriglobales bacterium]|nr:fumarylacetoacetate hydrolase family protein [Terriglobales bacterium]
MKFCRFVPKSGGEASRVLPAYGLIEGESIHEISAPPWHTWSRQAATLPLREAHLLAPVEPSKIVCVGRNYAAHAAELGNDVPKEPLIFLKPPSGIVGPGDPIVLTRFSNKVEHEGELAVVMGKTCAHLSDNEDPLAYVLGYACLNDVTARDLQKTDVQFARAKGFDTFCPIGPHVETHLEPRDVLVETRVNGQVRQSSSTSLMIYPVAYLIRWISHMMTLLPGDVLATGTPAGVGPLAAGDSVDVSISGIGVLHNPVHPAAS